MSKLLIEVYLPATLTSFDIFIPANVQIFEVTTLIAQAIVNLASGLYIADEGALLLDRESGNILNINMTAWELGLRNGSRLMLI